MIKPQIFINTDLRNADGSISQNWVSADINPDVNITVKDKIKDSKDVGKVFSAYTNQFKLPASKANNRIFKRFASHNIYSGFDPRRKYDCIIKLNGLDFKKGYIKLNSVNVKKNIPQSYNVQFFGELSSVKDILGNAKLKDLNQLSLYSYENTSDNVRMGFRGGFDVNITGGVREFSLLNVTQASTSGGTCTIILDAKTYSVDISSGLNEKETCEEIAYFIDTYVPDYAAEEHTGKFVFIVADEVGTRGNFTFVPFAGLTATATTVTEGADPNRRTRILNYS